MSQLRRRDDTREDAERIKGLMETVMYLLQRITGFGPDQQKKLIDVNTCLYSAQVELEKFLKLREEMK